MKGYPCFRSFRITDIEVSEGRTKDIDGELKALRRGTLGFSTFTILHPTLRYPHENSRDPSHPLALSSHSQDE